MVSIGRSSIMAIGQNMSKWAEWRLISSIDPQQDVCHYTTKGTSTSPVGSLNGVSPGTANVGISCPTYASESDLLAALNDHN